ncbi:MAG: type I glyceraldehyde-3-phosphate dehydrogenase [Bacilli bacterium]|nr:type I glyceraldehyde-3-phosphate dehydrogenase [Bacilli bacterium]
MIKIAINGFGRIGRLALRKILEEKNMEVVAINDLTDTNMLAHLLKYDTAQGVFDKEVSFDDENIIVDGKKIKVFKDSEPENLPWKELDVDIVLECTGVFTKKDLAMKHINAGAKKVIVSAPSDGDVKTIVYNVNHEDIDKDDVIISAASCTTNALAPAAKIINDNYKIVVGYMSTIHAYTNDQNLLDLPHRKGNLRRARAAASNIVPSSTGAAKAIGKVIKDLDGKLDGSAVRVPVISGSLIELTCEVEKIVTEEEINKLFFDNKNDTIGYTDIEVVSSDIVGTTNGGIFDSTLTKVVNNGDKQLIKISVWYDNEMGYTSQMIRTCKYLGDII